MDGKSMLIGALIIGVAVLGYAQHSPPGPGRHHQEELKEQMMLEEAHKGLEAMSTAASAVKDEQWGEAERALMEVQEIIGRLLREVADKAREKMLFATCKAVRPSSWIAQANGRGPIEHLRPQPCPHSECSSHSLLRGRQSPSWRVAVVPTYTPGIRAYPYSSGAIVGYLWSDKELGHDASDSG